MRLLPYLLVILMLGALLAGVAWQRQQQHLDADATFDTSLNVERFQQEIRLQAALADSGGAASGYPATIDPEWFKGDLPRNLLLNDGRPWVEIAALAERDHDHPRSIVALEPTTPAFWYNPRLGVVRARVPGGISDQRTIELYNEINRCHVFTLFPAR